MSFLSYGEIDENEIFEPDSTGVYPDYAGMVLMLRRPYSYENFYLYNTERPSNNTLYSDRLYQQNPERFSRVSKKVWGDDGQDFNQRKPEQIEEFLRILFDDETVELVAVIQGCNIHNGNPLWAFRYNKV